MSAYNVNIHEIRPRLPGSPGGNSFDDPHLKRRRLSIKQEETRLNFLKILFFFLLLTSAAVELFCWYVWLQTSSSVLIGIAVTCIFTMMGSILGLIGAFQGIGDLHARHSMLESGVIKTTPGEDILMYSFYFLICVFTSNLVFGSAALFFQEQPLSYLAAKNVSDEQGWQEEFEGKTLEEVQEFTILMVSIAGYSCYLMSLIITLIFYFIFLLSTDYEAIQTVLQVINYGLLLLGLAIIYLASYCLRYRDQMDFTNISPIWVTTGILMCGFFLIFLAYYGFYAAFTEKDSIRKLYVVFAVVLMFSCAIFSVASVKQGREFRTELSENCLDIMQNIDSVYMEGLGCKHKYINEDIIDDQLNCTKSTIAFIWEEKLANNQTIKSHNYGCLNEQCCDTLVKASKSIFDYLGICAASAIALSAVAIWGGVYLHEKIVRIGRSEMNKAGYKILTMMILSTLLTVVVITIGVPVGPRLPPYTGAINTIDKAAYLDPKYINPRSCYKVNATEFIDSLKRAEEFRNDEVLIEITSYNGMVYHHKNDNSKETASSLIRVKTKEISNLIPYLKNLQFCITCPQQDAYLSLSAQLQSLSTNSTSPL